MKKILMCSPDFFEVIYEINPWMDLSVQPEAQVATEQWMSLKANLESAGALLSFIKPEQGLPDMVYTANGGIVNKNRVMISKFRVKERAEEEKHFEKWFIDNGIEPVFPTKGYFEGEGDALMAANLLVLGHGFRSELKVADEVANFMNANDVLPLELTNPYFYHLDTCFCPLGKNLAFFHKSAFSKESVRAMEKHFELFCVPEADAQKFVCNSVVVEKNIVLPSDCRATEDWLKMKGYIVYPTQLNQFLRGGGSAKCLTLYLN